MNLILIDAFKQTLSVRQDLEADSGVVKWMCIWGLGNKLPTMKVKNAKK